MTKALGYPSFPPGKRMPRSGNRWNRGEGVGGGGDDDDDSRRLLWLPWENRVMSVSLGNGRCCLWWFLGNRRSDSMRNLSTEKRCNEKSKVQKNSSIYRQKSALTSLMRGNENR